MQYSPGTVGIFKTLGYWTGPWERLAWASISAPDQTYDPAQPAGMDRRSTRREKWAWSANHNGYFPRTGAVRTEYVKIVMTSDHTSGPPAADAHLLRPPAQFRAHQYSRSATNQPPQTRASLQVPRDIESYELWTIGPNGEALNWAARILREGSHLRKADHTPRYTAEHWIVSEKWEFDRRAHTEVFLVKAWDNPVLLGTTADLDELAREIGEHGADRYYHHLRDA